ncbi:MFS family permease [Rhizobium azooxidifex]|uniref:MFS family permease n=1 Tax=Mycoplana azooxidifex TaxID=1636188 RepID=A0A7W6D690_9HYPH|nr:MFS transporter [Mycoplana azooxidifex]MBB3977515.1 MFS family permease [Mycoplana azooxidifex]
MAEVPTGMSRFSIASPLAGGALHAVGSGLFHTLLPLRLVAEGHGPDAVGLVVGAEGAGFLLGCIGSVRLIRNVGEVRAYAALSATSAVLILSLGAQPHLVVFMAIQAVVGFSNAGQAVVIESWMNAMVANRNRGRILTLYVLLLGLFYGMGQLLATDIDPAGQALLMITAAFYVLALVPVTAIWVGEPQLHVPVGIKLFKTFRISPIGAFACLMTGLISSTFASIGPLYGLELQFSQQTIVLLMAATQLGALFLQFPLGYLSDRTDRRMMMLWLSLALAIICSAFLLVGPTTPFWVLLILFSVFGGISEIFYPLGVAHANDRADPGEFVTLSSNLLLIWAFGGTIGPAIVTAGVTPFGANIFFWYSIGLSVLFALYALWRHYRQPAAKAREQFVAYPQTSPMVYEWTPHDEAETDQPGSAGTGKGAS